MRVNIDDTTLDEDGTHYLYQGELFTGELVETLANGTIVTLKRVRNGQQDGVDQQWYPDGTPRSESTIVSGSAVGLSRQWHPNGQLAEEAELDHSGDVIWQRCWAEDGTPIASGA
jgi:antitoxin component YwqK of YwqJK toxin-antitoxin module